MGEYRHGGPGTGVRSSLLTSVRGRSDLAREYQSNSSKGVGPWLGLRKWSGLPRRRLDRGRLAGENPDGEP